MTSIILPNENYSYRDVIMRINDTGTVEIVSAFDENLYVPGFLVSGVPHARIKHKIILALSDGLTRCTFNVEPSCKTFDNPTPPADELLYDSEKLYIKEFVYPFGVGDPSLFMLDEDGKLLRSVDVCGAALIPRGPKTPPRVVVDTCKPRETYRIMSLDDVFSKP